MNFLLHKPLYFLLGLGIGGVLAIFSWITVKKIQKVRLPGKVSQKLEELKLLVYEARFDEVDNQLEEILPQLEQVNDISLDSLWNRLKKQCTINISMKKRLENADLTRGDFLHILKEIHRNDLVDPSIESEVVDKLKQIN